MDLNTFRAEWLGRVIDYDHVYKYQCVDLILQYIYECYGIAHGVSGDAIDYWVKTGNNGFNEPLLTKFDKVPSNEAEAGDIVVLNGLPGNQLGHIGIATGNINATEVEILEQNGSTGNGLGLNGDVIRVRYVARSRVAGLLRPKVPVSTPAPVNVPSGDSVHLPADVTSWAVYRLGSQLRKGTSDQVGSLNPAEFGGLTYHIVSWVGNYAVVISTQDFGQVALWVKDTPAEFSNSAPAAPAPPVIVHPYTIETITPKQIKLNKNTHLWGLNYDNFTAINANPQADAVAGTLITVRAILHHNIGYNYYLTDPTVASGYNVVDCDDYAPPPPPAPEVPYKPPAAPMTLPNSETYEVVKEVGGFLTSNMAINHIDEKVKVHPGTYFVFNKRFHPDQPDKLWSINVTKTPGKPGAWIAADDNVETPPEQEAPAEPTPPAPPAEVLAAQTAEPDFADTYRPVDTPKVYVAMRAVAVADLTGKNKTVTMPQFSVTKIAGSFTVEGVEYARPVSAAKKDLWYGIAWADRATNLPNLELETEVWSAKTTISERQATHTLKPLDKLALFVAHAKKITFGFTQFLGKIRPVSKNKN